MMKKTLITALIFFIGGLFLKIEAVNSVYISKNALIPVYPSKTLSTSTQEEGDIFYFIVPSDLWIDEFKIIPANSIVKAQITMLKMPVTGIDAAMVIKTTEVIFPNKEHYEIKGTISYKGDKQIGGKLTPPLSYNKSLHPRKGEYYDGVVAQYVPSGKYEFGQHITIMPNQILHIILDEDFSLY